MSAGFGLKMTSTLGASRRFDNMYKTILKLPGDRASKGGSSPLSTTPSPNCFDVLSKVEEEPQLDTAGSFLTHGKVPNHPADRGLAAALALSMDAKGKSPQTRWQQE
jgi:hypothetical protein